MNSTIMAFICVACGGALGAVTRYTTIRLVGTSFPWATFIVNIVGCTLASFIAFRFTGLSQMTKSFIVIGFMGALTTMSTFTTDTMMMLDDGRYGTLAFNVFLNVGICLLGAIAGRRIALILTAPI